MCKQTYNHGLVEAVRRQNLPGVKRALASGADLNHRNGCRGETALMAAARYGNDDILELLLAQEPRPDLHARSHCEGLTALHYASERNHLACVDALLAAGADPLLQSGRPDSKCTGRTAREVAGRRSCRREPRVVALIDRAIAGLEVRPLMETDDAVALTHLLPQLSQDDLDMALTEAARANAYEAATALLQAGANAKNRLRDGRTPRAWCGQRRVDGADWRLVQLLQRYEQSDKAALVDQDVSAKDQLLLPPSPVHAPPAYDLATPSPVPQL
ncbi:uncharacterized protein MONBRDRAFT_35635 [Monosiga brevicollis MX1]|uniref:Uncharacterized protein n=1 Tax=Monosiga brevicollis TaxID=81824 RepID=A9UQE7_MONBE|nr:uncharacterized protein MONBRDRAFT_35635 [Monosiga brevicollis MX1]EDQ93032.1 predicted protein [Monosiga brevicollis MX1]|eukprot:XP_001742794.1 hypothetical protein [Monosiga brevicollis MX1]